MDLSLNYLKTFYVLAQLLHFSKTAEQLRIAQPAVSRQIRELELQLGTGLFLRDNRRVELTPAGRRLFKGIEPLFKGLEDCISELKSNRDEIVGEISLACPRELGELLMIPLVRKFKQQYKRVKIDIRFGSVQTSADEILSGDLLFALVAEQEPNENLRYFHLLQQSSYLVTHPQSAVKDLKFRDLKYIAYRSQDRLLERFLKLKSKGQTLAHVNIELQMNSHLAIVDFLSSEPDYYAVLPYLSQSVKKSIEEKNVQMIANTELKTDIFLVMAAQDYIPKLQKTFVDFLRKEVQKFL